MQEVAFQSTVGRSCQDSWHFHSLSDGEASGPLMVGEEELGTSPPGCGSDTWGVPCPPLPGCLSWSSALASRHQPP